MDLSNVISTTENLLYQLTVWLVLLPRTLFRVVTRPTWIPNYVAGELGKPNEQQFDEYMTPLLFFVLLTIVPNLIANTYWPQYPYTDFATDRNFVGQAQHLSTQHRFFVYSLIWMLLPLSFALVHLFAQKKELSGSQLKPLFYSQCLRVAPLGLVFGLQFITAKALGPGIIHPFVLSSATVALAAAWLLYSDIRISVRSFNVTPGRAVRLALASVALYYLLIAPEILLSVLLR